MRPRKKDRHLPPCVHHRHGAYYLVRQGKWARLGRDLAGALAEYARTFEAPKGTLSALVDSALNTMKPRLSIGSWKQYQLAARKIKHMLAEFSPEQVKPKHVAQMKLALAETPNTANLCLTVLRQVFEYAVDMQLLESNPAVGIKRLPEPKRERLISREEYDAIYAKADPGLQCIMDLAYLTGQRVVDVLGIRHDALLAEGIAFRQQKTGARLVVRWTPELRAVVDRAKALHGNVRALTLLHNRRGKASDYDTLNAAWRAACDAAGVEDAQFRDLRAMSGTAAEQQGKDPSKLLGHKDKKMTERYLRDRQTPVVDGPSFGQVLDLGQKVAKK
jgi:integrase